MSPRDWITVEELRAKYRARAEAERLVREADHASAAAIVAACADRLPAEYRPTLDTWYQHAMMAAPAQRRAAVASRVVAAVEAARATGRLPRIV